MENNNETRTVITRNDSVVNISSKQSQVQIKNVTPPVKSKETKKE